MRGVWARQLANPAEANKTLLIEISGYLNYAVGCLFELPLYLNGDIFGAQQGRIKSR